jgi:hypothetical protein
MDDSLFGTTSYLLEQTRAVDDYTISQIITKELNDSDLSRLLIVVTGASHVMYGPRGSGVPGRISKKVPKKDQVVVLLDPESQVIRREGELPIADFLWYSAAKPCTRNCFDRAEIARVMNAAGRTTKALPQVCCFIFTGHDFGRKAIGCIECLSVILLDLLLVSCIRD